MKKLYFMQSLSIFFLLLSLLKGTYSQIMYFSDIIPISLSDLFIYLFLIILLFFSIKNKIYASLIVIYSSFTIIKLVNIYDIPATIFNSIVNGNLQLAMVLFFLCLTVIMGGVIFVIWLNKIYLEYVNKK